MGRDYTEDDIAMLEAAEKNDLENTLAAVHEYEEEEKKKKKKKRKEPGNEPLIPNPSPGVCLLL
jgi:hypothetical protein